MAYAKVKRLARGGSGIIDRYDLIPGMERHPDVIRYQDGRPVPTVAVKSVLINDTLDASGNNVSYDFEGRPLTSMTEVELNREILMHRYLTHKSLLTNTRFIPLFFKVERREEGRVPEMVYLWIEFIPGEDLTTVSQRSSAGTMVDAAKARGLIDFLFADCGCLHGDPHPGNFMKTEDGTILIIDFGRTCIVSREVLRDFETTFQTSLRLDVSLDLYRRELLGKRVWIPLLLNMFAIDLMKDNGCYQKGNYFYHWLFNTGRIDKKTKYPWFGCHNTFITDVYYEGIEDTPLEARRPNPLRIKYTVGTFEDYEIASLPTTTRLEMKPNNEDISEEHTERYDLARDSDLLDEYDLVSLLNDSDYESGPSPSSADTRRSPRSADTRRSPRSDDTRKRHRP